MSEAVPSEIPPPKQATPRRKRGSGRAVRKCYYCNSAKPVHAWISSDRPVCITCYQKHVCVEKCVACGNIRTVRMRKQDGGAICHTCYQRIRPEEICAECGKPGKIARRLPNGKGQCNACYQRYMRKKKRLARPVA